MEDISEDLQESKPIQEIQNQNETEEDIKIVSPFDAPNAKWVSVDSLKLLNEERQKEKKLNPKEEEEEEEEEKEEKEEKEEEEEEEVKLPKPVWVDSAFHEFEKTKETEQALAKEMIELEIKNAGKVTEFLLGQINQHLSTISGKTESSDALDSAFKQVDEELETLKPQSQNLVQLDSQFANVFKELETLKNPSSENEEFKDGKREEEQLSEAEMYDVVVSQVADQLNQLAEVIEGAVSRLTDLSKFRRMKAEQKLEMQSRVTYYDETQTQAEEEEATYNEEEYYNYEEGEEKEEENNQQESQEKPQETEVFTDLKEENK